MHRSTNINWMPRNDNGELHLRISTEISVFKFPFLGNILSSRRWLGENPWLVWEGGQGWGQGRKTIPPTSSPYKDLRLEPNGIFIPHIIGYRCIVASLF